ncbi:hypothetical protein CPB83DRAFT_791551 [Crepidotus variabilis]|uniref:Mtf2-like C-terminal domain-containing protein n=1 Tax=Crepidotus variabilis TaxID=179855 RepID=A0A9P6EFD2_9AGAR|nr:hypothetical protein CPB83DRAFT_791551 [Crepidotus variabilis]
MLKHLIDMSISSLRRVSALSRPTERLPILLCTHGTRYLSSQNSDSRLQRTSTEDNSIFSSSSSPWDQIFNDNSKAPQSLKDDSADSFRPLRRQTITERENKVITGMLDMIFNKRKPDGVELPDTRVQGVGGRNLDDLVSRLRRHSKPLRWAKEPTAELWDQKKEEMLKCDNDQELLEWAKREVFDESKKYETTAKPMIGGAAFSSEQGTQSSMLQSPIYPKVIAHLMRTFRDHYRDPNLTLFIFHHAQKLSVVSYVFGCSTESYNELIQTRWSCFRDLQGVHNAVQEMAVNGVPIDGTTRKLIETVRRDIRQVELHTEAGEGSRKAVWGLLSKVERLVAMKLKPKKAEVWDRWKSDILNEGAAGEEDWAFDTWDSDSNPSLRWRKSMNTRKALTRHS